MDRSERDGARLIQQVRDVAPVVAEQVGPMPYPVLNSAFDALVPPGLQHYWKANFATELTDDAIAAHVEHGPRVPVVNSTVHIYPINGACHRVAPDATAFAYRDANFATVIAGMWPDPADNEANTAWVKNYYAAIAPYSQEGGYVNFMAGDDQGRIEAQLPGQLRAARRRQAEIRSGKSVPAESEHQALTSVCYGHSSSPGGDGWATVTAGRSRNRDRVDTRPPGMNLCRRKDPRRRRCNSPSGRRADTRSRRRPCTG